MGRLFLVCCHASPYKRFHMGEITRFELVSLGNIQGSTVELYLSRFTGTFVACTRTLRCLLEARIVCNVYIAVCLYIKALNVFTSVARLIQSSPIALFSFYRRLSYDSCALTTPSIGSNCWFYSVDLEGFEPSSEQRTSHTLRFRVRVR